MKNNTIVEIERNKIKTEKKRIDYFDIAKGIGIILMIIGHMPIKNEYIKNFIYSFHMPLFFIISGYFFKPKENKACIKNIIKKLIIPYIITCIIIILYKVLELVLEGNFKEITNSIKIWGLASLYGSGFGTHFGIRFIGAIWFLLALGLATYIMNLIYNQKYRYLWVIVIAYVGYKTSSYIWLPFSIQAGMVALLFVYIGVLAKENEVFNKKFPFIMYLFLISIAIFCIIKGGKLYMVSNTFENGWMDLIGGISSTFLCIKFSMLIDKYSKIIKNFLIFIGKNSLICMCIHLFSLDCLTWKNLNKILKGYGLNRNGIRNTIINILFVIIVLSLIKVLKIIWTKLKLIKNNKITV